MKQGVQVFAPVVACCAIALASMSAPTHAQTCREISDSLERLRCYDKQDAATPSDAKPPPKKQVEDSLVTKAKAAVRKQLRDADSARFQNIKIKTVAKKRGLCGELNAKNANGGMTGFIPFTYDGEFASILMFNAGPGNPTTLGPDLIGVTLGRRLKDHDTWCGK